MTLRRDDILRILGQQEQVLRGRFGVRSLALFGSAVRDEAAGGSDVDLLVEFDRPVTFFDLCKLEDYLSGLLGGAEVDLVLKRAVIEDLQDVIYGEAVDVIA